VCAFKDPKLEIFSSVFINEGDFRYTYSRSGGPGGQNVNKVNTRVTLYFDVANCDSLTAEQKKKILFCLASRSNKSGQIHVVSQRHRSQALNRKAAVVRLTELLTDALKRRKIRKPTKVPGVSVRKRLEAKRRRSMLKQQRSKGIAED